MNTATRQIPAEWWCRSRGRIAGGAVILAGLVWTWVGFGPHVLDDAYITFRYSRNLAVGEGLVYNPGERVLGTSTPLVCVCLGGLGAAGVDIPTAGVALSVLAGVGTLLLLIMAARRLDAADAGWIAAAALATQFFWVLLWVSGMETTLYSALILATLLLVATERWRWIGLWIGLTCLVRYDGALLGVAALGVGVWRAGWKPAVRQAAVAAAVYLPWFLFSWWYFGSPTPQTVRAKQVINLLGWKTILTHYRLYLQFSPLLGVWLALAVGGAWLAVRRHRAWSVVPLWVVLYAATFFLQRRPVMYYPWYLVPLLPPMILLGALGLRESIRGSVERWAPQWAARAPAAFLLIAAAGVAYQVAALHGLRLEHGRNALHRERKYQLAAGILSPHLRPGDSIYVGEVGTLGWFLPKAHVIDSAGLLSPRVYEIRLRDREALAREGKKPDEFPDGSPEVTWRVIRELDPDFITTSKAFLFLEEIRKASEFQKLYEPIESSRLDPLQQWAYRRVGR